MGSLKRCEGSSSCSMYSRSAFGGKYVGRLNCRNVRSDEFVTRRLRARDESSQLRTRAREVLLYRPDFAKSSPRMMPAPAILCRATIWGDHSARLTHITHA